MGHKYIDKSRYISVVSYGTYTEQSQAPRARSTPDLGKSFSYPSPYLLPDTSKVSTVSIVDVVHREGRRRLGLLSSFWCHARILLIEDGTEASELVREDSS